MNPQEFENWKQNVQVIYNDDIPELKVIASNEVSNLYNLLSKEIENAKAKAEGNEIIAIERGKAIQELQKEIERLKALLTDIDRSLYLGEDLNDKEILDWYIEVTKTIKESIREAVGDVAGSQTNSIDKK